MDNLEFKEQAKKFFTPEELERIREFINELQPRIEVIDGEKVIVTKAVEHENFLGKELNEKILKFAKITEVQNEKRNR